MTSSSKAFDVIIVGAGPAGWSSAIFLARANVKTLVIGDPAQSGLADASEVQNYAGFTKGIGGIQLLEQMQEQAVNHGATFLKGEVTHVEKNPAVGEIGMSGFLVRTATREEFFAKNLLLAHGANFIKVNLPGEKELAGKGAHYCAMCDGPLYKGKEVLVLGNGNLAAEEALELVGMGVKVTKIITQSLATNMSPEYQEALKKQNIPVVIDKLEKVEAVTFIALGVAHSATFAQKLGLEMSGNFLKADANGRTNIAGVWTAGLARGGVNQVAKSVGEGATAAVDIIKSLKGLPQYLDHD